MSDRLRRMVRDFEAVARSYGVGRRALLIHLVTLFRRYGIRPREAHGEWLSNPDLGAANLAGVIPKSDLLRLQIRLNAPDAVGLAEDKALFYAYCDAVGLPIPDLYAVFDRHWGWTSRRGILRDEREWEAFVATLPEQMVIKPARGVYGQGLRALTRAPGGFRDVATGELESPSELVVSLFRNPDRRLVIQERLENHPEIVRLTGSATLQTVRIRTLLTREGECLLGGGLFKIVTGKQVVDNFSGGQTGNLSAAVRLDDGVVGLPIRRAPDGIRLETVETHPGTGEALQGFALPGWAQALALVRRAAVFFSPLRSLGWDVGLTPGGPVLVEANPWWDPVNVQAAIPGELGYAREMEAFLRHVRAEAASAEER